MKQHTTTIQAENGITNFKSMPALGLIIIALYVAGCSTPKPAPTPPQTLPVVEVATGSVTTFSEYPASIEGVQNVEIRPQVSGTLSKLFVDEGAFVKAGQALFGIDERPFRAALNNAAASLHAAEGAMVNARLEVEKLTPLVQHNVVSDYQLKTAVAAQDIAKANIELAQANVATARINLGYTVITAPTSGYIGRLLKKTGSLVGPSDPDALTLLSDVHVVRVYFALAEKDFVSFKDEYPGTTISDKLKQLPPVSLQLSDNTVYDQQGHVDMVDGQFDKNTGAITMRANFQNPKGLIRSGNTGKIRLSLLHKNALIVPMEATLELQDKVFVFAVADSNKVKKQEITIIGKSGENYLISDGLKSGHRIVLSGFGNLQDGNIIIPAKAPLKSELVKN